MIDREDDIIEIDVLLLLKAIWHRAWAVLLISAVFFAAGFFYSDRFITPKYTATCMIYVNNTFAEYNPNYAIQNSELTAAQSLVDTYIVILETPATLQAIREKSGLDYTTEELKSMIKAEAENETEIFKAKVTSTIPYESIKIANTITEVLPDRISEVVDGSSVRTVQKAYRAPKTSPARKKWALVCGFLGFLLACLFIIIKELRDDNIYDEDYIYSVVDDIPVLANIPDLMDTRAFAKNYYYGRGYGYTKPQRPTMPPKPATQPVNPNPSIFEFKNPSTSNLNGSKKSKYVNLDALKGKYGNLLSEKCQKLLSFRKAKKKENLAKEIISEAQKERMIICDKLDFTASEAYKVLRTNLMHNMEDNGSKSKIIGITSADRQEGKSTTSINLSYVFAQTNQNVLTIEGDLRIPAIAKRLGVPQDYGLTDMVNGDLHLDPIKPSGKYQNWKILTSGSRTSNPSETLSSDKIGQIFTKLKARFDIIIIDLPPINEVTDAMAIAPFLDGIVFVVKQSATKKMPFNMALRQLQLARAPLTGFVMTNSNGGGGKYDKYSKYGRYGKYRKYGKYSRYGRYGKYGRYDRYGKYSSYGRYDRYDRYDRYGTYVPDNYQDDDTMR